MATRRALSSSQAAIYLGIHQRRLASWRTNGLGPPYSITQEKGKNEPDFLYSIEDLDQYLHDTKVVPRFPLAGVSPARSKDPRPLTDAEWEHIKPLMPFKGDRLEEARRFIDGCLYTVWTNRPWHLLPADYGNAVLASIRFKSWGDSGLWRTLIGSLSIFPDFPYKFIERESICVTNFKAVDRQQVVTHFLDCSIKTIGPDKVPYKSQRRLRERKHATITERLSPETQAKVDQISKIRKARGDS